MSETKFTHGPWMLSGQQKISNGKRLIAITQGRLEVNNGLDENMANANLIAAAPDLYNALETLTTYCEIKGIPTDAAYAALAKARGES